MSRYFNYFPKLIYTSNGTSTVITDLMTRPALLQMDIDNSSLYYQYDIQEGDTPEIIASKYYGDAELHWAVMIPNQIIDPLYDWPMAYQQFIDFITDKYGSQANALSTIHHYERIISSTDGLSGQITSDTFVIPVTTPFKELANVANTMMLPSSNNSIGDGRQTVDTGYLYVWDGTKWVLELSLTEYNAIVPYTTSHSVGYSTVSIEQTKQPVDCYSYEEALNESKRTINLIRKELISDVKSQFINLMSV